MSNLALTALKIEIENLQPNENTKFLKAIVSDKASYSGRTESFDVCVFRVYRGGYKIQWSESGTKGSRPRLPGLKPEVAERIAAALSNPVTYLTSGYNDKDRNGMSSADKVIQCINLLGKYGITILISS